MSRREPVFCSHLSSHHQVPLSLWFLFICLSFLLSLALSLSTVYLSCHLFGHPTYWWAERIIVFVPTCHRIIRYPFLYCLFSSVRPSFYHYLPSNCLSILLTLWPPPILMSRKDNRVLFPLVIASSEPRVTQVCDPKERDPNKSVSSDY